MTSFSEIYHMVYLLMHRITQLYSVLCTYFLLLKYSNNTTQDKKFGLPLAVDLTKAVTKLEFHCHTPTHKKGSTQRNKLDHP